MFHQNLGGKKMKILRTHKELNAIHFFKNHIFVFKGKNHLIDTRILLIGEYLCT